MYQILKREGRAKRGRLSTVHGVVETPVFMNVGTVAAIKGAVSTEDLEDIGTQVELSNTYHLHVRPGDKVVRQLGGCIASCPGTSPFLRTLAVFRCSLWQGCVRLRKKGCISALI